MAKLLFRKKALLVKKEVIYGTDPVPTGALNAIQTKDLSIDPLEGEELTFDIDTENLGAKAASLVGKHVKVSFKVAAGGAGAAGDVPAWGVLVEACGHTATVDAGVSVTYTPKDTDTDSVTMYVLVGRTLHQVTGSRGTMKFSAKKRDYPWFEFEFMGLFGPVLDQVASLGTVLAAFVKPLPFRASTVEFELGAYLAGLHDLSVDFGQKVEFYEHSEEEQIMQVDRQAKWQGTLEEPDVGTHNFYTDVNADTQMAFSYIHGSAAGNIVEIASPATQLLMPKRSAVNDIAALQLQGPFIQAGSGPEYSIIAR
jgi:hypothetical protein